MMDLLLTQDVTGDSISTYWNYWVMGKFEVIIRLNGFRALRVLKPKSH